MSFEEVAKNDFNLSVSQYVFIEKVKPPFDAVATELQARADFITRMKKELEFSKMISSFEGLDFEEFPRQIIKTAQGYIGGINATN